MATKGKKSKEIGGEMSIIPFYYMLLQNYQMVHLLLLKY